MNRTHQGRVRSRGHKKIYLACIREVRTFLCIEGSNRLLACTLELTRNQVRLAPEYKRGVPVVVVGTASGGERATRSGEAATPER
jgi:hypothetical protein